MYSSRSARVTPCSDWPHAEREEYKAFRHAEREEYNVFRHAEREEYNAFRHAEREEYVVLEPLTLIENPNGAAATEEVDARVVVFAVDDGSHNLAPGNPFVFTTSIGAP